MVGACSTTSVQVTSVAPPPASLMVEAPKLQPLNKLNPTPEEAIEVVLYNYGLYHDISARLHSLQKYVNDIIIKNN